jgi:hypothetical protein
MDTAYKILEQIRDVTQFDLQEAVATLPDDYEEAFGNYDSLSCPQFFGDADGEVLADEFDYALYWAEVYSGDVRADLADFDKYLNKLIALRVQLGKEIDRPLTLT